MALCEVHIGMIFDGFSSCVEIIDIVGLITLLDFLLEKLTLRDPDLDLDRTRLIFLDLDLLVFLDLDRLVLDFLDLDLLEGI
jgi:hypothetical protein